MTSGTPRPRVPVPTIECVSGRDERLAAGSGLVAVLAVGVAMLLFTVSVTADLDPVRVWVWWIAYVVYAVVFASDADFVSRRPPWPPLVTLIVQVVSGSVVWVVYPQLSWTAVLFVVTAASAAFLLELRGVAAVVVLQSIVLAAGAAQAGLQPFDVAFLTLLYTAFQVFAAIVPRMAMRESRARAELAAANADLSAAMALLGASSRNAERLRIARDLHDVVGHQLTALTLELEIASHQVTGPAGEHVLRARGVAKDLLRDVRSVVGELRGAPQGLEPALRQVVSGLPGLTVDLEVREERPLDEARCLAVVRSVQEVTTNTLRHASATRLVVRVVSDDDGVRLTAHDDGTGATRWQIGNGLRGMRERLAQLGGELDIDPGPGRGFAVAARIPAS